MPQGIPKNTYPIITGNAALNGALMRAKTPLGCDGCSLSEAFSRALSCLCFDFVSSIAKTIYHSRARLAGISRSSRIPNASRMKSVAWFSQGLAAKRKGLPQRVRRHAQYRAFDARRSLKQNRSSKSNEKSTKEKNAARLEQRFHQRNDWGTNMFLKKLVA